MDEVARAVRGVFLRATSMTALSLTAEDLVTHAESLRRLARDLLSDDDLARDVVQDAFVTALQRPPPKGAALVAWLRRVVRHAAFDLRRTQRRRERRERLAARAEADGGDLLAQLGLQEAILAAVRGLREPYRTAIWLRYYEERTPAEIAQQLREPVKTVKTRLARGLAALRARLDRRDGGREAWRRALLPLAVGGAMESKKVALVLGALALAIGTWWFWPPSPGAVREGSAAAAEPVAANAELATRATAGEAERRALAAPTSAPAEEATLGTLVVHARWHDGTPAPDVGLVVTAANEPMLDRSETRAVTDAAGTARIERLRAGPVAVASERGGEAKADVVAGRESEVRFAVPRGVDVEGDVVAGADRPVAGARIWLATGRNGWLGGRVVATADAGGRFRVRDVARQHSLGALAVGFTPSELVDLEKQPKGEQVEVRLRLAAAGAVVEGRVVAAQGQPVGGASVAVGNGRGGEWLGATRSEHWTPRVECSDSEGRFRCEGVEVGAVNVAVRASGYALWTDKVDCRAGATTTLVITLLRGAEVHGTVRDAAGEPVASAEVTSRGGPLLKAMFKLGNRLLGGGIGFPPRRTRSDAQGRYVLTDVAPGTAWLFAGKWSGEHDVYCGAAQASFVLAAEQTATWDAVLSKGASIKGRVLGPTGTPHPHTSSIEATPDAPVEGAEMVFGNVAQDGSFVIDDCVDAPYTVACALRDGGAQVRWLYRSGVRPSGEEVVLQETMPVPAPAKGAVTGRLLDAAGRSRSAGELSVVLSPTWQRAKLDGEHFAFDGVAPDRYRVLVRARDETVHLGPEFTLGAGERIDVGDVVTEPPASVAIVLRAPAGVAIGAPAGRLDFGPPSITLRWDGERLRADNVSAGRHRLELWGQEWCAPPQDLDLRPLQENEVVVDLLPAVKHSLEVAFPPPDQWRRGDLVLRDARGKVVSARVGMLARQVGMRPVEWNAPQPAGTFVLEATTDAGHQRSWPVDLSGSAPGARLRFSLR